VNFEYKVYRTLKSGGKSRSKQFVDKKSTIEGMSRMIKNGSTIDRIKKDNCLLSQASALRMIKLATVLSKNPKRTLSPWECS